MPDLSLPLRPLLVGIDVGGTFTDFVALERGELRVHKVSSTPHDQSAAIIAGLDELLAVTPTPLSNTAHGHIARCDIVHGSTVATNALLERRGARTALLTTAGFGDVLEIGRQNRPALYDLVPRRSALLVPRELRFEVAERLNAQGQVVTSLDEDGVRAVARRMRAAQAESVAVVFLFSFLNPAHEERAGELLRAALPDVPISLSCRVLPEHREYERTATTVINAYVRPPVARYLGRLQSTLQEQANASSRQTAKSSKQPDGLGEQPVASDDGPRVRVMQSNGGAIGLEAAASGAARLVLSGPAGGVVGAWHVARQAMQSEPAQSEPAQSEAPRIITLDMGGTSTDVALCPGRIEHTAEGVIAGLPLRLPAIDIHTVGAGGGSIARVDEGFALRVGPQSAGAHPGPACYGRGGAQPTVSDANLVLGRLDAARFLGGRGGVTLNEQAARDALSRLGEPMGLSTEEAALGVVRIADATMERALRRVSVERGHDPRDFVLMPFGGAGPLHACALARALGVCHILVVPHPGTLSALGMIVADVMHDESHALLRPLDDLMTDDAPLRNLLSAAVERVHDTMSVERASSETESDSDDATSDSDASDSGANARDVSAPSAIRIEAALDLRYRGQSYELTVPLGLTPGPETLEQARDDFRAAHMARYGHATPGREVEVVALRVRGTLPGAPVQLPRESPGPPDASAALLGDKPVWFDADGPTATPCYDRDALRAGHRFCGPALVFQFDSTLVVAPGWDARVDQWRNIRLQYVG